MHSTVTLNFKKLSLSDKKVFERFFEHNPEKLGWEYSFAMTFIWNAYDLCEICDLKDVAIVRTKWRNKRIYYPPLLKEQSDLFDVIDLIVQECRREGVAVEIRSLTKSQILALEKVGKLDDFTLEKNRDKCDYIYSTKDLINLNGRAFHSKRNFITRFKAAYPSYNFREYNESQDRQNIYALLKKWNLDVAHEADCLEDIVITRALDNYIELQLKIGVLYVGNALVAFSISDTTNPIVAHTFFEKADKDYIGSYPTINQLSAQHFFAQHQFVNRQEDLGIEGLRKAKLSYNPVELVDKFKLIK